MKKPLLKVVFVGMLALAFVSGFALAQTPSAPETFLNRFIAAQSDPLQFGPLMDSFAAMPGNALVTKQAARIGLSEGRKGNDGPNLTAIVMQNQKLIEQNAQILEQLKKIAAKK